ncbi:class I fructose-bisphosphate aldolase [Candidatus Nucleicultrix amoebiphila]|jgi:class I fructose-bisphosphate aldolase|uniref:fructose-bisphosphate aldolase n=1 Tax=Candidatus Nucleicultrix amoebiphila FS5 TaxID=1414854 RepID=A0A1W6N397_9PROT|nr:class I fructose-bisphosphate aldolase [Candidatus Nucleicultrix amoebiphila]ARN84350.1 fructose-bisphosphate aldolase [Candidatus Nucleicultrix amoebiphila FS5]
MKISRVVQKILQNYESDNPGTKTNLARLLTHGRLGNTGKMVILPVDQGFEHGPDRSFSMNSDAYDPHYFFKLAIEGGVSAYAAPLGMLEAGANSYAGAVPLILKMNSGNSLTRFAKVPLESDQAITATIRDALRLGCVAVGFTIYPGSDNTYAMMEEIRNISEEAKSYGLGVIIWSYPRGNMSKDGETAIDVVSYGAHMAALLGAHVIKVKLPSSHIEFEESKKVYQTNNIAVDSLSARVHHVMKSTFNGRRLVVFSGGETKDLDGVYNDAKAIREGGGHGSIIGRNCFQRPYEEALKMLDQLVAIYKERP